MVNTKKKLIPKTEKYIFNVKQKFNILKNYNINLTSLTK